MLAQPATGFPEQVLALQELIRGGFERHHTHRGVCAFRFPHDARLDFSAHLEPGQIRFTPGAAEGANAALTLQASALEAITSLGGQIDFRDPRLAEALKAEGENELYLQVVHSWQRPSAWALGVLARAEETSRRRTRTIERLERLAAPSEAEVLERIRAGIPFIVTGLEPTRLVGMTIAEFGKTFGQARLALPGAPEPVSLAALLERISQKSGGPLYTLGTDLPEDLVPHFPPAYFADQVHPPQIWFGAGKNPSEPVTPIHRDLGTGFLQQVYGRKRLTLFAPHEAPCVYPRAAFLNYQACWVAPHAVDLQHFPRFAEAHPVEAVLEPGELFIQPPGWFHQVYSLDEVTLSVSHFLYEGL
ncbi:cupin-like domain-containing protein [Hyalangium rubrum]|uniref:Cupin-like domain-containing protein n=1 Tax=Hyalangium rubrum TaxID=3103134 RepID=A0ABU5HF84_9BACT|nr:cupin-like domain-containing protein [Hyalangium sp. s54d21]MDY7231463.1 cupin-like domain-containing protein [Hyalangium sp. s54d21]